MLFRFGQVVAATSTALLFAFCFTWAPPAQAQGAPPTSLNDFVLIWSQGNYATPLVCKIEGKSHRGLRRILIEPQNRNRRMAEAVVTFVDLEAGEATRCFTEIGGDAPNITGQLTVRHAVTKSRDTAKRDFSNELRRKRGFTLNVVSGTLTLSDVGGVDGASDVLDLRGGEMSIRILRPGSDAVRLLKDLPSPRQVELVFTTQAGRVLTFPASLSKPKGPVRSPAAR